MSGVFGDNALASLSNKTRGRVALGKSVSVTVPATSANLGPGFDTLGLALGLYDDIEVVVLADGLIEVNIDGIGADSLPRDASHLVIRAMTHCFSHYGVDVPGFRLTAVNRIPHGRGLGSSGAAIVAGVIAAKGLLSDIVEMTDNEALALATDLEGHPDNVAPALFGGLTIAWTDEAGPRHKKLPVHRGVYPVVFVPEHEMSTALARSLQPQSVPHEDAVFNVSRSALLIAALLQSPELLFAATEDKLHQNYRSTAMLETNALITSLRENSFAAVVSGAGPSILVLVTEPGDREKAAALVREISETPWQVLMPAVDVKGATVIIHRGVIV